jgi:hypothetical protein
MARSVSLAFQQIMTGRTSAELCVLALLVTVLTAPAARAGSSDDLNRLVQTGHCPTCDLSDTNLSGMDLEGADLSGATLVGADLSNANLQHADLSHAILNSATLSGANFSFANLRNASLQGARMPQPANFTGANLTDLVMPNGSTRSAPVEPDPAASDGEEI